MAGLPDKWPGSNIHSIYPLYWGFICLISTNLPAPPRDWEKVHMTYDVLFFSKALCILNYCIANHNFNWNSFLKFFSNRCWWADFLLFRLLVPFFPPFFGRCLPLMLQIPICNIQQVKRERIARRKNFSYFFDLKGFCIILNYLNYCIRNHNQQQIQICSHNPQSAEQLWITITIHNLLNRTELLTLV